MPDALLETECCDGIGAGCPTSCDEAGYGTSRTTVTPAIVRGSVG